MQSKRTDRVAELLKREISRIIMEEIKDPGIQFVTISKVNISPDLKSAKIFYTVLGDLALRASTHKRLEQAVRFIRSEIGRRLELRYVPEIRFYYDTVADQVEKIEGLLGKIKEGQE